MGIAVQINKAADEQHRERLIRQALRDALKVSTGVEKWHSLSDHARKGRQADVETLVRDFHRRLTRQPRWADKSLDEIDRVIAEAYTAADHDGVRAGDFEDHVVWGLALRADPRPFLDVEEWADVEGEVPKIRQGEDEDEFLERCRGELAARDVGEGQARHLCALRWANGNRKPPQEPFGRVAGLPWADWAPHVPEIRPQEAEARFLDRCQRVLMAKDVDADDAAQLCEIRWQVDRLLSDE